MEGLNVVSSPLPFSNKQINSVAQAGSSISEIVNSVVPEKYFGIVDAVVFVNDQIIPRSYWSSVKPKPGTIINVRVIPQGGGDGKNPLATVLSLAVLVAAPYAAGAILGQGIIASTQFGALAISKLVTGAIGVVGNLLISAIAPPPKPSYSGLGNISNPAESPTLFIEGASNSFNPYGTVPVVLGTNRIFPLQCAKPFTETQNDEQFVRQMFTYGYGEEIIVTGSRIGETPVNNFTDVQIERFNSGNLHEGGTLWTNSVSQEDMSVLLSEETGWVERSVSTDSDEVIVDFNFARGLTRFDDQGRRTLRTVRLDVQYRAVGDMDWIGGIDFQNYSGDVFTSEPSVQIDDIRKDIVVINNSTGEIKYIKGSYDYIAENLLTVISGRPQTPSGFLKIANVDVVTDSAGNTDIEVIDARSSPRFEDSDSFVPSKTDDDEITISSGGLSNDPLNISAATSEAFVRSHRIIFPQSGDYEIRVRRVTNDTDSTQIIDLVYLSAVKGVRYIPPVSAEGLNGVGVRIKATNQLNGSIDQWNDIVSNVIPDYDSGNDQWITRVTSNPASIYRYVLQGAANATPVPDSKIDFDAIESWHDYCSSRGYTCDIVIDYETSIDDVLKLVCSAGSASPAIVDGKYSVVVDRAGKQITQIVTPRNSWGYSGEMVYPEIPHAFRVIFRNKERGYQQDERIVYADGYDASNATLFETLELRHCTDALLAWKHARRYLATALLRPETHSFYMDVENLVSIRGDRIKFEHDVPLVGVGDGRIKEVLSSEGFVTGLVLDDTISFPSSGSYYVRVRYKDGSQIYREINSSIGSTQTIFFTEPFSVSNAPETGDLCYVNSAGGEMDLVIKSIEPSEDLTARITCVNYAPEIFDYELGNIPSFNSNITTPLEFIRPSAPVLISKQSDEDVMIRNVDGTFTSVAVFTLDNNNDNNVSTSVEYRISGANVFQPAIILSSTPEKVVVTGMDDGFRYDFRIRYRRTNSNLFSLPLQLNNYLFVGRSGPPSDVENFRIDIGSNVANFVWDAVDDIDFSHYEMRFSSLQDEAEWETSQVVDNDIRDRRITLFPQSGTYFVKAVDLSGNYSVNPAVIIATGLEGIVNAVALLEEDPDFPGEHVNTINNGGALQIEDASLGEGFYYFEQTVDLTDVFTSSLSASLVAGGAFTNNLFDYDDLFAVDDLFGVGQNDLFDYDDLFAVDDLFGIGSGGWSVQLEYRFTNDDPESSFADWSEWEEFSSGALQFRAIQFRLRMTTLFENITPSVTKISVNVDMPDRIERGEDLTVPAGGAVISFDPAFKEIPSLSILLQDGDADDKIEFTSKTVEGFEFFVYNTTSEQYVERVYDYIASGYGRVST